MIARLGRPSANEYRIIDGQVQFRVAGDNDRKHRWRLLSDRDVRVHLSLKTQVGKWLARRRRFLSPLQLPMVLF